MTMKPYHGTCLVNGRHPEGSLVAKECPQRNAAARAERARRAAAVRWRAVPAAPEHVDAPGAGSDAPALAGAQGMTRVGASR